MEEKKVSKVVEQIAVDYEYLRKKLESSAQGQNLAFGLIAAMIGNGFYDERPDHFPEEA